MENHKGNTTAFKVLCCNKYIRHNLEDKEICYTFSPLSRDFDFKFSTVFNMFIFGGNGQWLRHSFTRSSFDAVAKLSLNVCVNKKFIKIYKYICIYNRPSLLKTKAK